MPDFPAAVNAPGGASYSAPLLNFGGPGGITNAIQGQIQKQRDMDYQQSLRTAFQGGVPMIPGTNMPDYGAMATKLIQLGDTSQGVTLANADVARRGIIEGAKASQNMTTGNLPGDNNPPGVTVPPHGIPDGANLPAPGANNAPVTGPRAPAPKVSGNGDNGQNTLMTMIGDNGVPDEKAGFVANTIAKRLNIDPNAPITDPKIAQSVARQILAYKTATQPKSSPALAQSDASATDDANGDGSTVPAPSIASPAPAQSAGSKTAAPNGAALSDPTLGGLVPTQWVQKFGPAAAGNYIRYLTGIAAMPGIPANTKEAAQKRADSIATALQKASEPTNEQKNASASGYANPSDYTVDTANRTFTPEQKAYKEYTDQGGKLTFQDWTAATAGGKKQAEVTAENSSLTPEQKNAGGANQSVLDYERSKEEAKDDVKRFGKMAEGLDAAGAAATSMMPHLQLARSLMNSPDFYSGAGEGVTLAYKRAVAALGGDPNQALPQEGFRKVMAANILDQVAQLKAETQASGGATRIFQSQIALMEKAAQNPDNTIAANRLLTEMGFRAASRAQQIADMANNYNGGHLNPQFNIQLRKWNADHPLFTPQELADPRLIAPPIFSSPQAVAAAKLPKGTPFKTGDGRIKYVP
jgi:hypothetical protein